MTEHKNLAAAVLAFQGEALKILKKSEAKAGSFGYKYADIAEVIDVIQASMTEHGIVFQAFPCYGPDGQPALRYTLTHAPSGDCQSETMPLVMPKPDPQGLGSGITYGRRYALVAVLNLIVDDDDGKSASGPSSGNGTAREPVAREPEPTERIASAKQRGLLNGRSDDAGLAPSEFATAILKVAGQPPKKFDTEDIANQFVNRQLGRLPARLVDPLLEEIKRLSQVRS